MFALQSHCLFRRCNGRFTSKIIEIRFICVINKNTHNKWAAMNCTIFTWKNRMTIIGLRRGKNHVGSNCRMNSCVSRPRRVPRRDCYSVRPPIDREREKKKKRFRTFQGQINVDIRYDLSYRKPIDDQLELLSRKMRIFAAKVILTRMAPARRKSHFTSGYLF